MGELTALNLLVATKMESQDWNPSQIESSHRIARVRVLSKSSQRLCITLNMYYIYILIFRRFFIRCSRFFLCFSCFRFSCFPFALQLLSNLVEKCTPTSLCCASIVACALSTKNTSHHLIHRINILQRMFVSPCSRILDLHLDVFHQKSEVVQRLSRRPSLVGIPSCNGSST